MKLNQLKTKAMRDFEKIWCKDKLSGFLSPLLHMDDIRKLLDTQIEKVYQDCAKRFRYRKKELEKI